MKIAVFSDTHRNIEGAKRIISAERPDCVIHLGDYYRDGKKLREQFPGIRMEFVPGNCDLEPCGPKTRVITLAGVKLMLTHGHEHNVKMGMTPLLNAAHFQGVDMVLFGHTHQPLNHREGDLYVVNPGTAGEGSHRTWAKIVIEDGEVKDISILEV